MRCPFMYGGTGSYVYKKVGNARGLGAFAYTGRTYAYFSYTHYLLSGGCLRNWVGHKTNNNGTLVWMLLDKDLLRKKAYV
jgi:hypothetical protein